MKSVVESNSENLTRPFNDGAEAFVGGQFLELGRTERRFQIRGRPRGNLIDVRQCLHHGRRKAALGGLRNIEKAAFEYQRCPPINVCNTHSVIPFDVALQPKECRALVRGIEKNLYRTMVVQTFRSSHVTPFFAADHS